MQSTKQKRQRSENWLPEDRLILKDLVRQRVQVIENKNTDADSNCRKVEAWEELRQCFNSMCKGPPRTVAQIRAQWSIIKMTTKKNMISGEGREKPWSDDSRTSLEGDSSDDISIWLPNTSAVDSKSCDTDIENRVTVKLPSPLPYVKEEAEEIVPSEPDSETEDEKNIILSPPSPPIVDVPQTLNGTDTKLDNIKKKTCKTSPTERLASFEIKCRKQLHAIQMENEEQKKRNLYLKELLLLEKIIFYKNKNELQ